jgi:hypothetical protein
MGKIKDLTGQKFNKITVLSYHHSGRKGKAFWLCLCECGNRFITNGWSIQSGHAKSCGCQRKLSAQKQAFKDILGQRFGRLVVIEKTTKRGFAGRNVYWKCLCDCGKTKIISGNSLRSGFTKSCGCLWFDTMYRGGFKRSDYPKSWSGKLRSFIRDLDNHVCQFHECTYTDIYGRRKLNVHHIDGNKKNCKTYNLISLCNAHHIYVERNKPLDHAEYFYSKTIGERDENCSFLSDTQ